eukprot:640642-Pelagomonas_calceolata.AAC.1
MAPPTTWKTVIHVHLIQNKNCGDTRPGQQLEAAQGQHTDLCTNVSGDAVMLNTILLGVGENCYDGNTLDRYKGVSLLPPTSFLKQS